MFAGKLPQCWHHPELLRELLGRDTSGSIRTAILFGVLTSIYTAGVFLYSTWPFLLPSSPSLYPVTLEGLQDYFINLIILPRRKLRLREVQGLVTGHEAKVALFHGSVIWSSDLSAPSRSPFPQDSVSH